MRLGLEPVVAVDMGECHIGHIMTDLFGRLGFLLVAGGLRTPGWVRGCRGMRNTRV